ncbi:hypothetical protein L1987_80857 [Smallanthus sonchifolius]|uniref:Uncharacterized protein n=1 Tax=Smallanthus sonchifolius TaxID=185202 RepID=A0ACB8YN41_9ASTR|nr:hypothetical protein L1987_80857 [Smallanthus sonchifolius]
MAFSIFNKQLILTPMMMFITFYGFRLGKAQTGIAGTGTGYIPQPGSGAGGSFGDGLGGGLGGIGGGVIAKALVCLNDKIYSDCEESYRLTETGDLHVPPDYTDQYCGGPCLKETDLVLNCINAMVHAEVTSMWRNTFKQMEAIHTSFHTIFCFGFCLLFLFQKDTIVQIAPQPVPPPMPQPPNLPCIDLLQGRREDYVKAGIPLYEAAIKGDWKAAKPILDKQPNLIRFAITENYETLLHIEHQQKAPRLWKNFLAAAAGNVKTAMGMVKKNPHLIDIPGNGKIMPLNMAALFGKPEMVRYLYYNSKKMTGDFWDAENQGWVLQRCVEAEIFDVALRIVNDRPELTVKKELLTDFLLALAQKTHAFKGGLINQHLVSEHQWLHLGRRKADDFM